MAPKTWVCLGPGPGPDFLGSKIWTWACPNCHRNASDFNQIDSMQDISDFMQIADKYVLKELVDACDSYLAQWCACILQKSNYKQAEVVIRFAVKVAD